MTFTRRVVIPAVAAALGAGACGQETSSVSPSAHEPRSSLERSARDVVTGYLRAVATDDARAACRHVAGDERRALRCHTAPRIPSGRRVAVEGRVLVDGDATYARPPLTLFGSARHDDERPTVFFTVAGPARRLRIVHVGRGARA